MDSSKPSVLNVFKQNNLQALLDDPEFADFFKWFENNITDENILTAEEIEISSEMKESGTFIDDHDEISKKFTELGFETSYNEHKLEILQEELNDYKESESFFSALAVSNRATELKLDEELRQLKLKKQNLEENTQSIIEDCKEYAETLEELQVKNLKSLADLKDCYARPQNPPLLWCKLNLSDYCLNCDKFALRLKIRADEIIKLGHLVDQDEALKIIFDLSNIEKEAYKKTLEKVTTEVDINMVNHLIGVLSGHFEPMSYSQMMEQTKRMSLRNEDMNENIEDLRAMLNDKIKQFALQEAKFCELAGNREKLANAKNRLDVLKRIHEALLEDY